MRKKDIQEHLSLQSEYVKLGDNEYRFIPLHIYEAIMKDFEGGKEE